MFGLEWIEFEDTSNLLLELGEECVPVGSGVLIRQLKAPASWWLTRSRKILGR